MTDDLATQIRAEIEGTSKANPYAHYDAAELAEDTAEAKRHGCSVDELRAARRYAMPISEYLAFGAEVRSVDDAVRVEDEAKARTEAKAEAQRQARVAAEARNL